MPPLLPADERKRRLDLARRALQSGSASEMARALDLLPDDGNKAQLLRTEIRRRLACGGGHGHEPHTGISSTDGMSIVSGEYRFCFTISDLHVSQLFVVKPKGGVIEVALNSSHPAFRQLMSKEEERLSGSAERALLAWVRLLLHAGSDRRREHIEELCAQWASFLAESPAEAYWGHGHLG